MFWGMIRQKLLFVIHCKFIVNIARQQYSYRLAFCLVIDLCWNDTVIYLLFHIQHHF